MIIPTHNHATYLPASVESALAQTPAVDVVVVDDGSTDDTESLVRARWAGRLRYIRQDNRGPAAARNAGLASARGPFVVFLDADDTLAPECVARRLALLDARADVGWVHSDLFITDAGGGVIARWSERYGYARRRHEGRVFEELLHGNFLPTHGLLIRRECLDAVGGFDESVWPYGKEDWELWVRLAHRFPLAYLDEPLGTRRQSPDSLTTKRAAMARSTLAAMERIEARFPADVAAAATAWRRMRADQYLRVARGSSHLPARDRLRWILRAVAARPIQGAAYRELAGLVAGRRAE